ncbi:MAG: hypothetical protein Q8O40_04560 [Chloroflexota bacterium]|nr:hypothetical protein [Chloroflexota bacterium]
MPKMYPVAVRNFAVAKRREGHAWSEVREMIKRDFGVDPAPTVRQMATWASRAGDPEALAQMAMQQVRRAAPEARAQAEAHVQSIVQDAVRASLDGQDAGVMLARWFFSLVLENLEKQLGVERLNRAFAEVVAQRAAAQPSFGVVLLHLSRLGGWEKDEAASGQDTEPQGESERRES